MKRKTKIRIAVGIGVGTIVTVLLLHDLNTRRKNKPSIQHLSDGKTPQGGVQSERDEIGCLKKEAAMALDEKGLQYKEIRSYPDSHPFSSKKGTTVEVLFDHDTVYENDNFWTRVEDALDPVLGDHRDWDGTAIGYNIEKEAS